MPRQRKQRAGYGAEMINLFPDQSRQIESVAVAMRDGHRRVLMQAATGAGKTVMASEILRRAGLKGSSTWFVVPRKELLRQTSLTYDEFGIPHSYIASGYEFDGLANNYIVSLQTLKSRYDSLRKPDMVIIDECHYGAGYMDKLVGWLGDAWIIGLSATPKKHNGDGMDKWFDYLVKGTPMKELIRLGRLSEYKMFAPSRPDLSSIKVTAGDYNKKALQGWMDDHGSVLIGDAVATYKAHAYGKRGLTFCASIKESERVAEAYKAAGIPAAHMDGTMHDDTRRNIINAFADGELMQITSVDLMCFGFDLAAQVGRDITVECMSDLAPTKSEAKQLQKWGRVLRRKDNPALIFDHAGNCFEHGLPCDDRDWTLKGREKKRRTVSERAMEMRQCKKCFYCHPPSPACPNCGNIYPVQSRVIKERDGELEEIKAVERVKKQKRMQVGMARSCEDLAKIAAERGYAKGWIWKQCKIKGFEYDKAVVSRALS